MRENYYNSSNIRPISMNMNCIDGIVFGRDIKSPINNAELQRIGLRTLETYIIEENIVRKGCSFRNINCIDGRLGPRMTLLNLSDDEAVFDI